MRAQCCARGGWSRPETYVALASVGGALVLGLALLLSPPDTLAVTAARVAGVTAILTLQALGLLQYFHRLCRTAPDPPPAGAGGEQPDVLHLPRRTGAR